MAFDGTKANLGAWEPKKSRARLILATAQIKDGNHFTYRLFQPYMIFKGKSNVGTRKTTLSHIRDATDSDCQEKGWNDTAQA